MKKRLKRYWKLGLAMLVLGFVLGQAGCIGSPTVEVDVGDIDANIHLLDKSDEPAE